MILWATRVPSPALARGGRLVTCGATSGYEAVTDLRHLFFKGLSLLGSTMGSRAELLRIARYMGERRLRPVIDRVLRFEQIAEGHRAIDTSPGSASGGSAST